MPDMTLEEALSSFNQANALVNLKPSDILSLKKTIYSNNISINDWNAVILTLQKLGISTTSIGQVLPVMATTIKEIESDNDQRPIISETQPDKAVKRQVWIQPTDEAEDSSIDAEFVSMVKSTLNKPDTMVISNYETLTFGDASPNETLVFENSSEDLYFESDDEDNLTFGDTSEDEDFTFEN